MISRTASSASTQGESRARSTRNPIAHPQITKKSSSTPKSPTVPKTQPVRGVAGRHKGHNTSTMAMEMMRTSSNGSTTSMMDSSAKKEAPTMFCRVPSVHCMITRTLSSAMEVDFQALWGAPPGAPTSVAHAGTHWNGGWP